jgi:hypothetical protein
VNEREKIDMEVIALTEEVIQKVQDRHGMARANVVAERLRLELMGDGGMDLEPRAFRPRKALLLAIAPVLQDDAYLRMSESEFVAIVMRATGGANPPTVVAEEYRRLIDEAGVNLNRT